MEAQQATRRALVIINRRSRSGSNDVDAVIGQLQASGIAVERLFPSSTGEAADAIQRRGAGADLIVVGGGDGTLHNLAPALVEAKRPVGILPLGTANDLARTLAIPLDPLAACQIIAQGHRRPIDLGRVNGTFFFNAASIGLGVQVTHALTEDVKKRWGAVSYARALVKAVRQNRSFRATIICGEQTLQTRTIQVAVGNGRHYGGGMTIAEEATVFDHILHMYSIRPRGFWSLLRLAPAVRSGRLEDQPGVYMLQGERFQVSTRRPMTIHADGEPAGTTPATFEVIPEALTVFAPRQESPSREQAHAA